MESQPIPDIFAAALVIESERERKKYLDEACGDNTELRDEVEALLRSHREAGSFFADGPENDNPEKRGSGSGDPGNTISAEQSSADATVGTIIGPYKLVQRIGEGGMGEVWVAKQSQPVKRKVALKLIKKGMDSRAALARFEQERQALAMMEHPNIAHVFDAGISPDGQPYFVMELVNGLPVNKFCDEARLSLEQRLELFVSICQAVQHAHQKGIVHRDLKPANVLVTLIDGRPVPKVIDFGVAKALSGNLTAETLTEFGAVVGTLEYMSPEQASFSGTDVDTRADIYSLGVILYELLTGLRPIDKERLRTAALNEMIRIIREEEPSKPSTRLSTDQSLPSMAALRQTDPRKLMSLLRGELDWVVMKCLEKDRDRRYDTANGLVRDLQRYLASEPVEARPPSSSYRLRKFLVRNRGPAIAASLLLLTLLAGIVGTIWGLFEARRQAEIARRETVQKQEALQAETAAKQEAQRQTKLAHDAVDKYLNTVTEDPQLKYDNFQDLRKKLLETAIPFYEAFAKSESDDPQMRSEQGMAYTRLAAVHGELGEIQKAIANFKTMQSTFTKLVSRIPDVPEYQNNLAESHRLLALYLSEIGDKESAVKEYRAALEISKNSAKQFPDVSFLKSLSARIHDGLGSLSMTLGDLEAVQGHFQQAVQTSETLANRFPDNLGYKSEFARYVGNLSVLQRELGNLQAAREGIEHAVQINQILVEQSPKHVPYSRSLAVSLHTLANLLAKLGETEAARNEYEASIEIWKQLCVQFPNVPAHANNLALTHIAYGILLKELGELRSSEEIYKAALDIWESLAKQFPEVLKYRDNLSKAHLSLANLLCDAGEPKAAEQNYKAAQETSATLSEQFPQVPGYQYRLAQSHLGLGKLLIDNDELKAAEENFRTAKKINAALIETFADRPKHLEALARSQFRLGNVLRHKGDLNAGAEEYRASLENWINLVNQFPNSPNYQDNLAWSHSGLGCVLKDRGDLQAAQEQFNAVLEIRESMVQQFSRTPERRMLLADAHIRMAEVLEDLSKKEAAIAERNAAFDAHPSYSAQILRKTLIEEAVRQKDDDQLKGAAHAVIEAFKFAVDRDGRRALLAQAQPSELFLKVLIEHSPSHGLFWLERVRMSIAERGFEGSRGLFEETRQHFDQQLRQDPLDADTVANLAELLLLHSSDWSVLKPLTAESEGGADLETLDDGSLLASGRNPEKETYEVIAELDASSLAGIRLEGLPHLSLSHGGYSREKNGNVCLSEIEAAYLIPGENDQWRSLNFTASDENSSVNGMRSDRAIDGNIKTHWSLQRGGSSRPKAVFQLERPIQFDNPIRLRVRLRFESSFRQHQFGRFRLSTTENPHAIQQRHARLRAQQSTTAWLKLQHAYQSVGEPQTFGKLLQRAVTRWEQLTVTEKTTTEFACEWAEILLLPQAAKWKTLQPTDVKSAKATLESQPDGTVLAGAPQGPTDDRYTVVSDRLAEKIHAIRLEMLTDGDLPQKGPGHHPSGNFALRDLRVFVQHDEKPLQDQPISGCAASFSWGHNSIRNAIDNNPDTDWHVWSRTGQSHEAVFVLEDPITVEDGQQLLVELHQDPERGLGRFRLSYVTQDDVISSQPRP